MAFLISAVLFVATAKGAPETIYGTFYDENAPLVRVNTLESEVVEGTPQHADSGAVYLQGHGEDKKIPFDGITSIEFPLQKTRASKAAGEPLVPNGHPICVCYFRDGGVISGRLLGGGARAIQVDTGFTAVVTVPFNELSAVKFATTVDSPAEAELIARLTTREATRDLLIVPKGPSPVVLPGALELLGPDGWEFRLPTRVQKATLDRAYAVVFAGATTAPVSRRAMVTLKRGDRFSADIQTAGNWLVTLDSSFGQIKVSWVSMARIDLSSNRVTWLADTKFKSLGVKSALGVDWTPRVNFNVTGGPIKLGGRTFARGIGVHGATSVSYDLDGKQSRLQATIGIDDAVGRRGSVIFRVIGDGRELFKSDTLRGGGKPVDISVDITGVKLLELSTDAADGLDLGDHADWADVRLIRAAAGGVS